MASCGALGLAASAASDAFRERAQAIADLGKHVLTDGSAGSSVSAERFQAALGEMVVDAAHGLAAGLCAGC